MTEPQKNDVSALSGLPGVEGIVIFENTNKSSDEYGQRTALVVGPACTHKTVAEFRGAWIGDNTTRRKAVAFCLIPTER